jgi:hypothetical protein
VGTVKKSIAAMPSRWFRRNVLQVALALGVRGKGRRYRETLRSETSKPRHCSSPWMRGAPQGFSDAILRMSARTSRGRRGRPDDGEGLGPTAPETAQQDPEDPIGGPDVWVPPPGQGGELLAEGQVLEHEISPRTHGGAERRQEGYKEAEHRAGENPGPGRNRQWFHLGRSFGER